MHQQAFCLHFVHANWLNCRWGRHNYLHLSVSCSVQPKLHNFPNWICNLRWKKFDGKGHRWSAFSPKTKIQRPFQNENRQVVAGELLASAVVVFWMDDVVVIVAFDLLHVADSLPRKVFRSDGHVVGTQQDVSNVDAWNRGTDLTRVAFARCLDKTQLRGISYGFKTQMNKKKY